MRTVPLQLLTWGTVTFAISSAAWLASTDQGALFCSVGYRATSRAIGIELPLPVEPTAAGKSKAPGPGAAGSVQAISG